MTTIEQLLRDQGPMLSSDLISNMTEANLTNEAIRKRISRLKSPVTKLGGFFIDNQSFFYLEEQFEKQEYFEALRISFQKAAKRYYAVIKALEFHNGYIKKIQLASFTFSPVSNLKTHKNISNIVEELVKLNVLIEDDEYYKLNTYISIGGNDNFRHHKGVELAKEIVLLQFYDWARKIGLVSYESGKFHSEFSKLQWGFVCPSYVSGILKKFEDNKIKPAFVFADVLIGNSI